MPNLKDLRKRLRSVTETKKITSAMKLVAAAKFRRAQEAYTRARPYAEGMEMTFRAMCRYALTEGDNVLGSPCPLWKVPSMDTANATPQGSAPEKLFVVMGSDKGLCGGFNAQLFRYVLQEVRSGHQRGHRIVLIPVGAKARLYFCRMTPDSVLLTDDVESTVLSHLPPGGPQEVYLGYNKFYSAVKQQPILRPMYTATTAAPSSSEPTPGTAQARDLAAHPSEDERPSPTPLVYTCDPPSRDYYRHVLEDYVKSQLYITHKESQMGEQGARMLAMDNATRNADDMIDKLKITYNRQRQAQITTELTEIISGAEALV